MTWRTEWWKSLPQNRILGKKKKRNEDTLRDLWDNTKCTNIHIITVPGREDREKGPKKIFEEVIAENLHNMGEEIVNQVQESQRVPGRINQRRNIPGHIVNKQKLKTKIKY